MRLPTKVLSFICVALLALLSPPVVAKVCPCNSAFADNLTGEKGQTRQSRTSRQDCRQNLQDLAGQKQTLTTALTILNTQINLTQAQIS